MCRSPQQKRAKHEEWISVDTRRKLDVRKEKKAVLNASLKIAANAKALEDNTQLQIEKLRKAKRKINVITFTTWPNKPKKQGDNNS